MDGTHRIDPTRPALRLVNAERGVDATALRPRNTSQEAPPIGRGSGALITRLDRMGDSARMGIRETASATPRFPRDEPRAPAVREPSSRTPGTPAASVLRLARIDGAPSPTPAEREVARENRAAASLQPTDARWALAVRTASSLDGGRAAILPPERRERLMKLSSTLGLRSFDAALVIAIVQDGARSGEGALSASVVERVALVRDPREDAAFARERFAARRLLIALLGAGVAGGMLAMALARWVLGT